MGRLLQDVSYRTGAGLTDVPLPLVVRVSRPDQRTNGTCRVAVRTATTGVASCVGGAPPSFPRMRSDVASERVPAAASPRSVPPARRKRARKTGWGHPSSRHYAECKLVSSNCDDRQPTNHETARCYRTKRNGLGVSIEAQILRSPLKRVARVATVRC